MDLAHTTLRMVLAKLSLSRMSPQIPLESNSWPLSPRHQSLLPSRPIRAPSNSTTPVSSPRAAVTDSTTVSSLSDTEPITDKSTSSSRTPGDPHGETRATSRSPPTSAVSPTSHPSHPPAEPLLNLLRYRL